jgi:acetyl-CoA carboxylase biotin carboxyl carrier protein
MSEDTELPDLRYVRELAKVFKQYGLDEIEIETSGSRILLRRGGSGLPVAVAARPEPAALPAAANVAPAPAASAAAPAAGGDEGQFITSPFVGTFYSCPRPDADTFVKVGQTVGEGDTVCIVEAMKLFNEIESEFPCVIEEMLVENNQPVEYGAKLFRVRRL